LNNVVHKRDGFTLVEVLICTLILTTGTLGIAALLAFHLWQTWG